MTRTLVLQGQTFQHGAGQNGAGQHGAGKHRVGRHRQASMQEWREVWPKVARRKAGDGSKPRAGNGWTGRAGANRQRLWPRSPAAVGAPVTGLRARPRPALARASAKPASTVSRSLTHAMG